MVITVVWFWIRIFSFFRCPWRHIEKPGTRCKWEVRWKTNGGWWRLPCKLEVGWITKKNQLFLKRLLIPRMKEEIEIERKMRYLIRFSYSFGIYFTHSNLTMFVKSVLKMLKTSGPKKKMFKSIQWSLIYCVHLKLYLNNDHVLHFIYFINVVKFCSVIHESSVYPILNPISHFIFFVIVCT